MVAGAIISSLAFLFFFLDKKEPKNQEPPNSLERSNRWRFKWCTWLRLVLCSIITITVLATALQGAVGISITCCYTTHHSLSACSTSKRVYCTCHHSLCSSKIEPLLARDARRSGRRCEVMGAGASGVKIKKAPVTTAVNKSLL